jgi:hypothetical protein
MVGAVFATSLRWNIDAIFKPSLTIAWGAGGCSFVFMGFTLGQGTLCL